MKVAVKYCFIFEPDPTIGKKSDIDSFIAQAFEKVGYQSELVQTGDNDDTMEEDKPEKTPRSQKFLASRKVE